MPNSNRMQRPALLTISKACRILGVSETTLRQWTDEGKVKAFVTPGGHRRYSEADLRDLLRGQHRTYRLRDLVARIESIAPRQREIMQQYLRTAKWYARVDGHSRERLRERGARLLDIIAQHVSKPATHNETLEEARRLGREYGADLAQLGLSLTEALEVFILHRTPVLDAATELLKDREPLNKQALASIPKVSCLIDQTLLALVEGHQSYANQGDGA